MLLVAKSPAGVAAQRSAPPCCSFQAPGVLRSTLNGARNKPKDVQARASLALPKSGSNHVGCCTLSRTCSGLAVLVAFELASFTLCVYVVYFPWVLCEPTGAVSIPTRCKSRSMCTGHAQVMASDTLCNPASCLNRQSRKSAAVCAHAHTAVPLLYLASYQHHAPVADRANREQSAQGQAFQAVSNLHAFLLRHPAFS